MHSALTALPDLNKSQRNLNVSKSSAVSATRGSGSTEGPTQRRKPLFRSLSWAKTSAPSTAKACFLKPLGITSSCVPTHACFFHRRWWSVVDSFVLGPMRFVGRI